MNPAFQLGVVQAGTYSVILWDLFCLSLQEPFIKLEFNILRSWRDLHPFMLAMFSNGESSNSIIHLSLGMSDIKPVLGTISPCSIQM